MGKKKRRQKIQPSVFSAGERRIWFIVNIAGYCCMMVGLVSIISFSHKQNLNGTGLFICIGILGLVLAYYTSLFIEKNIPIVKYKELKRSSMVSRGIAILFTFGFPATCNIYNSEAQVSRVCNIYEVLEKHSRSGRYGGYTVSIKIDGNIESIRIGKEDWNNIIEGTTPVEICIATGRLGISFIDNVRFK